MLKITKIRNFFAADFDILATLLMRSWSAIAGAIMVLGMSRWFSPSEQGYYFTFFSLLGLQVFFELGFNYVVTQIVSHEVAHLGNRLLDLDNSAGQLDRLASLIKLLKRWYAVAAVLFFFLVTLVGEIFFRHTSAASPQAWESSWMLLVAASAANLYVSPLLAVAEGMGFVGKVARVRLAGSMLGYLTLWLLLSMGAGLRAVPIISWINLVVSGIWLLTEGNFITKLSKKPLFDPKATVSWRTEIFPFQWRIALSWVSGYLIFQLFNPVIFAYQGPVEAGRVGLALTIFNTLLSMSMSWVMAKVPTIGGFLARGEHDKAKTAVTRLIAKSGAFHLIASSGFIATVLVLQHLKVPQVSRLPGVEILLCLAVISQANHFIGSVAAYIRAHKVEPLMLSSVVVAVLSLLAVFVGAQHSVLIMMLLYTSVTIGVSLPWVLVILKRFDFKVQSRPSEFAKQS